MCSLLKCWKREKKSNLTMAENVRNSSVNYAWRKGSAHPLFESQIIDIIFRVHGAFFSWFTLLGFFAHFSSSFFSFICVHLSVEPSGIPFCVLYTIFHFKTFCSSLFSNMNVFFSVNSFHCTRGYLWCFSLLFFVIFFFFFLSLKSTIH